MIDYKVQIAQIIAKQEIGLTAEEIAEMIEDGKLSKSGLNHRFRKIAKIAKELKEGTYQAK